MSADRVVTLVVEPDPALDEEAVDRITRLLRAELTSLDVSVSLGSGTVPEGAKAADAITIGALVVALSASGGVFTALIETLRDWLGRQSARHRISVTIDGDTIEVERASSEQRQALLDAYVRRHGG